MANKVLKSYIFYVTATTIGLYHHHLVRLPGVNVSVMDLRNSRVGTKRSHSTSATPVAVDVLNEDILRRAFNSDALVFVGNHDLLLISKALDGSRSVGCSDIVNPDIVTPNINAVQASPVTTSDGHVIYFTIGAGVHRKMKSRCVNKNDVMNGEVGDLLQTENPRTRSATLRMDFVSIA